MGNRAKKKYLLIGLAGVVVGFSVMIAINAVFEKTSTTESCMSCHAHPESDTSWKQSKHYLNSSGVVTECTGCHLPPRGTFKYYSMKTLTGLLDLWSYMTKDMSSLEWNNQGDIEYASRIVFNESCKKCHVNIFPEGIEDDGIVAHLYYEEKEKSLNLQCVSCHMDAGHYDPNYTHEKMTNTPEIVGTELYSAATPITEFANFTETIPGTYASINMIAIPGGTFTMGSPKNEPFRKTDEGPQKQVTISPFFMAEVEVTWNQFWSFFAETMSEGRTPPEVIYANNSRPDVDAISGPTPAFGAPDQGWGMGDRPAITMTHYSASTFCQWLSLKTGKTYRLPTEAEWEYAARAGSTTPYFFEGNPKKFSNTGVWNGIFGADTTSINSYAVYSANSKNRTQEPGSVKPNAFGLKNMLGNVMEYCSDWYAEDAYAKLQDGALDPKGPVSGKEHVVRGGFYGDDASVLRSASRSHTRHDAWLRTDPQNPKSIWWYSDIKGIGFRVVCEVPENIK